MKRIFHTWEKWECYPAGFYESRPKDKSLTDEDCESIYKNLLTNTEEFEAALQGVIDTWKNSCEHYLSNENMNRIAWLGQASLCYAKGIPSDYRGGFNLLTETEQEQANKTALKYLNIWLTRRGEEPKSLEDSKSKTQANLY